MLTIYGVYRSRTSRPLWLLEETGTPFTHVPVIQAYRLPDATALASVFHTASGRFLAINPQGQIPVMEEDGLILTESLAITLHVARRHGGALGPGDEGELSLMEQWALFAVSSVETPALEILLSLESGADRQPEGRAGLALSAEKLARPLARLDAHLTAHGWMVGGRFTVADLNMAECLRYAQGHPTLLANFPALNEWLLRCQERPAFRKMMARREAEPA